jgi:hypothetical protein
VPAGQAERVESPQRLRIRVEPLRARALRDAIAHELHRRGLAQLAGRHVLLVADHGGAGGELARTADARERQRQPARQRRVVVEERQVRGRVAGHVGQRVGRDPLAVEGVVGEAPAEQPVAGAAARALGRQRAAHLVERAQPAQVGAARAVGAVKGVDVAVDEPGNERDAAAVDELGGRPQLLADLVVAADGHDDTVAHRDRGRVRARRVERADRRADDREVGHQRRRQTPPSAVRTPSRIDLPQCGQVAVAAQSR